MAALGIGFAGSGFLIFYYFGILSALIKEGIVVPGQTPMGGLSGGGIASIQTCAQIPLEQQLLGFKMVLAFCRDNYPNDKHCNGAIGSLIKETIRQNLKTYASTDTAKRCSDRLRVSLSALNPTATDILNPIPWTISNFRDLDDLAEAAGGTCFISCFMAYKPFTVFRGVPVMDGGYTSNYKDFCPGNVTRCLKIASYVVGPNNPTGKSGCKSQTIFSPDQQTNRTTSKWSPQSSPLVPQSAWKLPTKCEYDAATQALMKPEEPGFTVPENPDIYPGFSSASPLPVDPCEWQSYSLEISKMSPATIQLLYDTGVKDAQAWIKQNPISAPAKVKQG